MEIRKACAGDIDTIAEAYLKSIAWLNGQGIRQWDRDVYPTRKTAEDALAEGSLHICTEGGALTGTFVLNEFQPEEYNTVRWKYTGGTALVLHTLVIPPEHTGRGYGRAVMEYVLQYAREHGYPFIRLDAFPGNAAAGRMYQSLGFELAGTVAFYIKEPGYQDYHCYEYKITDRRGL